MGEYLKIMGILWYIIPFMGTWTRIYMFFVQQKMPASSVCRLFNKHRDSTNDKWNYIGYLATIGFPNQNQLLNNLEILVSPSLKHQYMDLI